ncbi:RNA binding motif protein 22 [Blyttiomyces sp. JEL0837]|nr:RNA binding motif protein 22 [Blyttiomyces sp. JEL0837]
MRYKKTEICQTCAKIKNVCQTCVLDLEYGLPVQVRDSVLNVQDGVPKSDVNREYFIQKVEGQLGATDTLVNYGKADSVAKEALKKMARVEPYYKRNRAHICSFYVKGECKRGEECPYRHELPVENDLSHQNIKDRYYGQNDPVAGKMLNRQQKPGNIAKPADQSITSLFITGVPGGLITEDDLRQVKCFMSYFYIYGEIKSIVLLAKSKTAFINYETRASAEKAIDSCKGSLLIKDQQMRVQWGKSRQQGPKAIEPEAALSFGSADSIDPEAIPAIPAPPGIDGLNYAATNPDLLGSSSKTYRA